MIHARRATNARRSWRNRETHRQRLGNLLTPAANQRERRYELTLDSLDFNHSASCATCLPGAECAVVPVELEIVGRCYSLRVGCVGSEVKSSKAEAAEAAAGGITVISRPGALLRCFGYRRTPRTSGDAYMQKTGTTYRYNAITLQNNGALRILSTFQLKREIHRCDAESPGRVEMDEK